jgi:peptidoglycan/xylan/chitin deacetylase (PgdA/CDA1 family)
LLIAVNYHYIRRDFRTPYSGIYGLTPEQFESQLLKLDAMGSFVSAGDIIQSLDGKKSLPDKAILITFDDGLREQYELALPVLDKLGIPAVLYINTQNIAECKVSLVHKIHLLLTNVPYEEYQAEILKQAAALFEKDLSMVDRPKAIEHYNYDEPERAVVKYFLNFCLSFEEQSEIIGLFFEKIFPGKEEVICDDLYLTEQQIKILSERGYLGSHSHRHIPLGLYTDEEIEKDISRSAEIIHSITGRRPLTISYPYGSREAAAESVLAIAGKSVFRFGFTMERAANVNFVAALGLSRFDCNDVPGGKSALFPDETFFESIRTSQWFDVKMQYE